MLADFRAALRALRRAPAFFLAAVAALAVGIGATTAIFSVVDALLLRPMPYARGDQLAVVWSDVPEDRAAEVPPSYPDFLDWRAALARPGGPLAGLAFARSHGQLLRGPESAAQVNTALVSDGFFAVLGGRALLGRTLRPDDERPGAPRVVVLTHRLWRERFGGNPGVVGRAVSFVDGAATVVGVMPPGYEYPGRWAEAWAPLAPYAAADPALRARLERCDLRSDARVIARLAPDANARAATAALEAVARRSPETAAGGGSAFLAHAIPLREAMTGQVRRPLLVLVGAVGLLLLVACADVANLSLVRASGRARELAVRGALGAGGGRLARQLLAESATVALAGAAAGALLAVAGVAALRASAASPLARSDALPRFDAAAVDGRVLAFALAAASLSALLAGAAPAWQAARARPAAALQAARGAGAASAGGRFRAGVTVVHLALTLVLLVGAGLLGRSFLALRARTPGFPLERLVTLRLSPLETRYQSPEQLVELFARVREAAEALPGVRAAGVVNHLAMTGGAVGTPVEVPGRAGAPPSALLRVADGGFFAASGIPVRRGRALTDADVAAAARVGAVEGSPALVPAVVSASLARELWPRGDALGARFTTRKQAPGRPDFMQPVQAVVVGVAADVPVASLDEAEPTPVVYLPFTANPWRWGTLVVRGERGTAAEAAALVPAVRRAVRAVDADLPVAGVTTGAALVADTLAERRLQLALVAAFAGAALLLSAVGVYGVVAHGVARRAPELGVRAALGADRRRLVRLVLGEGARMAGAGLALGTAAAAAGARVLEGLVYGVGVRDAPTYLGVAAALGAVALAACWLPARRAARADPAAALRAE